MRIRTAYRSYLSVFFLIGFCACSTTPETKIKALYPAGIVKLNNSNFVKEVKFFDGPALVLFYNKQYWQSKDMEKRFNFFAKKFGSYAKFCKFHWDINADSTPYKLEMLPTVVLYKNGAEFDRIRGINPDAKARAKLNDDMELWIMKNALELKGSKYNAAFRYLFNNTYTLHVNN
ncbi:thioredoxin domain-containing protein [Desulfococcaceae bacterium HSG7]|nr:thioredoxin domain-containing protein [Desulfococcaceae bacterium HSG7]